jgi:hypothetical protein
LFTLQETGEWMALLAPILNTLFDHKKSVGERAPHPPLHDFVGE